MRGAEPALATCTSAAPGTPASSRRDLARLGVERRRGRRRRGSPRPPTVSPLIDSLMRSPRKVSTSDSMPGTLASSARTSSIVRSSSAPLIGLRARRGTRCGWGPRCPRPARRARPAARPSRSADARAAPPRCGARCASSRQRGARRRRDLEHEVPLAELRQELAAEERQHARARRPRPDPPRRTSGRGPLDDAREHPRVGGLEARLEPRLARARVPAPQQQQRERGRRA